MFNNPSPFAFYSGINLFKENKGKDDSEDYFSSQLTQSISVNSELSVQNSLINSQMSRSILSQSNNLEESQNKNLEENKNIMIDIDKDEQDKKQINIYINSKLFEDNHNINIICFNNNDSEKDSNNKNKENANNRNSIENENNRRNINDRRENKNEYNYLNSMKNLNLNSE